jgi:uncharacterized protein (DUF4415 family)
MSVEVLQMKPEKKSGKTNWEKLRAERTKRTAPAAREKEETQKYWAGADVAIPGGKTRMTVRFDTDVVEWFKSYGPKYQTRMNAVLRQFMNSQHEESAPVGSRVKEQTSNYRLAAENSRVEYMKALNELGHIRKQQGKLNAAAKHHEQAVAYFENSEEKKD